MKFNEKLIELRKQKGISQEELGYELNVTRQTVSKWELGQTTPEMDKLIEISRIFNITIDELINEKEEVNNEVEKVEDKSIDEGNRNNSNLKVLILVFVILIIAGIILVVWFFSKFFNFGNKIMDISIGNKIMDTSKGLININAVQAQNEYKQKEEKIQNEADEMINEYKQNAEKMQNEYEEKADEMINEYKEKVDEMFKNIN